MAFPVYIASLCAGVGGLDLGVRAAIRDARTVVYVEREAYACEVLLSRMEEKRLDSAPVWTDLRTFDGKPWRGVVDLVIGGYPCQPFSLAGNRLGADDPRHLWPDVRRIVGEIRPAACFFENVSGHVSLGLREVRADLESLGYRVAAGLYRASEVGAPHRRERLFILAMADDDDDELRIKSWGLRGTYGADSTVARNVGEKMADDDGRGQQSQRREGLPERRSLRKGECTNEWASRPGGRSFPPGPDELHLWADMPTGSQPGVCRMAHGLVSRVDRLRACGNGVIPQQAAFAFRDLWTKLNG